MAVSGFEGFEKRLELHFFFGEVAASPHGLRLLPLDLLEEALREVQCTVVSAVGNLHFDSYVLSESSLFVYPTKIIIKTCGTTQLLKSVPPLLIHARNLGLSLTACRYTRGTFIFPHAQPYPHTTFKDEVVYLEETLPPNTLSFRKASIMPSSDVVGAHAWHVFTACNDDNVFPDHQLFTVEVCMTELDQAQASMFFQTPRGAHYKIAEVAGREMTTLTGIGEINPAAHICDFAFDPCGYSMNSLDGDRYSTIHVTPEDGFSYASYECVGSVYDDRGDVIRVLQKVAHVFRPGTMSVSITCAAGTMPSQSWARVVGTALEALGYKCLSCVADEFPEAGSVIFQTFRMQSRRK